MLINQKSSYSDYQSHAPSNDFFPFRKLRFGGRQSNVSMTITASGVSTFQNHYFNVNSQSIRVALSSLLDSSINRNWEVRIIKSLEAPFSFVSLTGNVLKLQIYKQCTTTTTWDWMNTTSFPGQTMKLNRTKYKCNNLYYRMNYKNLTANLLQLSLPFYYWQSHLPYGSAAGLLCI